VLLNRPTLIPHDGYILEIPCASRERGRPEGSALYVVMQMKILLEIDKAVFFCL